MDYYGLLPKFKFNRPLNEAVSLEQWQAVSCNTAKKEYKGYVL